jgi:hypothetical protein
MSRPKFTSASCPNCGTLFARLPVEYDEDGGYAVLEVHPCADPVCGKLLCGCCEQFHCDGCGHMFCADHMISVEDGTETPSHCCPSCAEETEPPDPPLVPECVEVTDIWERGEFLDAIRAEIAANADAACSRGADACRYGGGVMIPQTSTDKVHVAAKPEGSVQRCSRCGSRICESSCGTFWPTGAPVLSGRLGMRRMTTEQAASFRVCRSLGAGGKRKPRTRPLSVPALVVEREVA